jgi:hypothetical protein
MFNILLPNLSDVAQAGSAMITVGLLLGVMALGMMFLARADQ